MSKFKKSKQLRVNYNEDSSDYISDIESSIPKSHRLDMDSVYEGNSNEYSNDSFTNNDRDPEYTKSKSQASKFSECLDYLHRMITRKDKEGIFEYPVTDLIAPGYSMIIKNPMDLGTMKTKIDTNEYTNIMEYRDDLILMCENCMTYNKPDTIYYQFAKKMLDYSFKLLSRERLVNLRNTVRCMRYLTTEELGFSLDASELYYDTNAIRKKTENKLAVFKVDPMLLIQNVDNNQPKAKESWLIAPDGDEEEIGDDEAEELLSNVKKLAQVAAERLMKKNPNGQIGFLRRNPSGTTGYNIIEDCRSDLIGGYDNQNYTVKRASMNNESNAVNILTDDIKNNNRSGTENEPEDMIGSFLESAAKDESQINSNVKENRTNKGASESFNEISASIEKSVTIGNLMEGLQASSYSMTNYIEEKKDKTKLAHFLETGPFSNQAPTKDTSFSNISKEDLNILASAYGDEFGYQYAISLMEFSKNTSEKFQKYVKTLLSELSCNEHEKYLKYITSKRQQSEVINVSSAATSTTEASSTVAEVNSITKSD